MAIRPWLQCACEATGPTSPDSGEFLDSAVCVPMFESLLKVDSWVSTVLHADSPPCAKSPTLKQVVLGRILTV